MSNQNSTPCGKSPSLINWYLIRTRDYRLIRGCQAINYDSAHRIMQSYVFSLSPYTICLRAEMENDRNSNKRYIVWYFKHLHSCVILPHLKPAPTIPVWKDGERLIYTATQASCPCTLPECWQVQENIEGDLLHSDSACL